MPIWEQKRKIIKHENLFSHIKWVKKFLRLMKLKLKNINFTAIKCLFLKDVNTQKVSNKISSGQKNTSTLSITWMVIIKLSHWT